MSGLKNMLEGVSSRDGRFWNAKFGILAEKNGNFSRILDFFYKGIKIMENR